MKFVRNQNRKMTQTNSVFSTFIMNYKSNRKYIIVSVNNKPVCFQFDTMSDITLMSQLSWKSFGKPCLSATDHIARSASWDQIHLTSKLTCVGLFSGGTKWVSAVYKLLANIYKLSHQ